MANVVVVGQRAANQAFNPAIQQAQAQVPAINQLYSTLLAGLQNQGQGQLQNVLASADQRGVMRGSQQASTQGALDTSLMQAGAQLGAQQAQNVAGVQGIAGQGQAQRALSAQQLVEGLTQADIASKTNKLQLQEINRADEINTIKNQVAEAKANARAAETAAKLTTDQALDMQEGLWAPGKDGFVSPRAWNSTIQDWIDAGGSVSSFVKRFGHLVNKDLYQQASAFKDAKGKTLRYKGATVKGD